MTLFKLNIVSLHFGNFQSVVLIDRVGYNGFGNGIFYVFIGWSFDKYNFSVYII